MLSILFLNANKYRHNISNSHALNSHSIFWHHAFSHLTVTRSTTSHGLRCWEVSRDIFNVKDPPH